MNIDNLNVEKLSFRSLLNLLTISQIWSILGALFVVIAGAFSIGGHFGKAKQEVAASDLRKLQEEHQALLARTQFFERAFEYYRSFEQWQRSIGYEPPRWNPRKYPCDENALAYTRSIEPLRKTVDRLRNYTDRSNIGVLDPRGAQISKAGGSLQIKFLATGDTWPVPDHYYEINPDAISPPPPCGR